MNELVTIPPAAVYDVACRAIAAAMSFQDLGDIEDQAALLQEFARRAENRELESQCIEIRVRAERRVGELLLQLKEDGRLKSGPQAEDDSIGTRRGPISLEAAGVSKNLSSRAQKLAKVEPRQFEEATAKWREKALTETARISTKALREIHAGARQQVRNEDYMRRLAAGCRLEDLIALAAARPKSYLTGYIDIPWHFQVRSEAGEGRSAGIHYQTKSIEDVKRLPIPDLMADDSVICAWSVDWNIKALWEILEFWGYEIKTKAFLWAKTTERARDQSNPFDDKTWHMGQGYWSRANPEDCWLATRGKPSRRDNGADVRQLVVAPVMEHSKKPDEVHDRIERLLEGPYLEIYGRRPRHDWTVWGNEIPRDAFHGEFDDETGEIAADIAAEELARVAAMDAEGPVP